MVQAEMVKAEAVKAEAVKLLRPAPAGKGFAFGARRDRRGG
ncbi:hypothetical protein [Novosphingobium sp. KA1]|nr:hypothetical protein [Novosphingobium sp. KA1]